VASFRSYAAAWCRAVLKQLIDNDLPRSHFRLLISALILRNLAHVIIANQEEKE
jgi:hypothetical protein